MSGAIDLSPRVLIIGGGPAGLRAASELAPSVDGEVLVVERESVAGGIPRHSDHPGYGVRDRRQFLTGPRYAERLREDAIGAGARILTSTMVTSWSGALEVMATSPQGRLRIQAGAIVLATGARERPRSARLIAGDRCAGVFTTGTLQNIVHLKHLEVGRRAVIVGSELVSWSAVLTLREAGCRAVALVTSRRQPETYAAVTAVGRLAFGARVMTGTQVTRILGGDRVTAVEVEDLATGERRRIDCDTVILTADWIADNELARAAGIATEPSRGVPDVDERGRTSIPGVFAAGNLVHPVATADVAALSGASVSVAVRQFLAQRAPRVEGLSVQASSPIRWTSPARLSPHGRRRRRPSMLVWVDDFKRLPRFVLRQDGKVIATRRSLLPASPGRLMRLRSPKPRSLSPTGGPVTITIE